MITTSPASLTPTSQARALRKRLLAVCGVATVVLVLVLSTSMLLSPDGFTSSSLSYGGYISKSLLGGSPCDEEVQKMDVDIVLVVHSKLDLASRRDLIRETWLSVGRDESVEGIYRIKGFSIVVKFFVGTLLVQGMEAPVTSLAREIQQYDDVIAFDSIDDNNLLQKGQASMAYYTSRYKFQFLVKTNDDCFLSLENIVDALLVGEGMFPATKAWGGAIMRGVSVKYQDENTEGKKYIDTFLRHELETYPAFASGTLLILTADVAENIASLKLDLRLAATDDASYGVLLLPYNVDLVDVNLSQNIVFPWGLPTNRCVDGGSILAVNFVPQLDPSGEYMKDLYTNATRGLRVCSIEMNSNVASEELILGESKDTLVIESQLLTVTPEEQRERNLINVDVVIIVHSGPGFKFRRDAIRQSWMRDFKVPERDNIYVIDGVSVAIKFFIGTLSAELRPIILAESKIYGDIVMLDNLDDQYQHILRKGQLSMLYYTTHYKFRYLLKTDDDCFLNMKAIPSYIGMFPQQKAWGGVVLYNSPVIQGVHKSAEPNLLYKLSTFPPYVSGALILMTPDIVEFIATLKLDLMSLTNDDASYGIILLPYELRLIDLHDSIRAWGLPKTECIAHKEVLVVHYVPQLDPTGGYMDGLHQNATTDTDLCSIEMW